MLHLHKLSSYHQLSSRAVIFKVKNIFYDYKMTVGYSAGLWQSAGCYFTENNPV
jgi:hypothetical protein